MEIVTCAITRRYKYEICTQSPLQLCTYQVIRKARLMHEANAYVHWYAKYGTDEFMFECAFEGCDAIVRDYEAMG